MKNFSCECRPKGLLIKGKGVAGENISMVLSYKEPDLTWDVADYWARDFHGQLPGMWQWLIIQEHVHEINGALMAQGHKPLSPHPYWTRGHMMMNTDDPNWRPTGAPYEEPPCVCVPAAYATLPWRRDSFFFEKQSKRCWARIIWVGDYMAD